VDRRTIRDLSAVANLDIRVVAHWTIELHQRPVGPLETDLSPKDPCPSVDLFIVDRGMSGVGVRHLEAEYKAHRVEIVGIHTVSSSSDDARVNQKAAAEGNRGLVAERFVLAQVVACPEVLSV